MTNATAMAEPKLGRRATTSTCERIRRPKAKRPIWHAASRIIWWLNASTGHWKLYNVAEFALTVESTGADSYRD